MTTEEEGFLKYEIENKCEIIAKIQGEEAKKLLLELQNGKGISFGLGSSSDESGGNDPIVYLYRD